MHTTETKQNTNLPLHCLFLLRQSANVWIAAFPLFRIRCNQNLQKTRGGNRSCFKW